MDVRENFFYCVAGETLKEVVQRGSRWPVPANLQGQAEQGSEQPDLVEQLSIAEGLN